MSRLTLEEAYRGLQEDKRKEVEKYIGVIVSAEDAPAAWLWMCNRIPDWGHGKTYEEMHGVSLAPAIFHFVQEDAALAMEFKLMWGGQ